MVGFSINNLMKTWMLIFILLISISQFTYCCSGLKINIDQFYDDLSIEFSEENASFTIEQNKSEQIIMYGNVTYETSIPKDQEVFLSSNSDNDFVTDIEPASMTFTHSDVRPFFVTCIIPPITNTTDFTINAIVQMFKGTINTRGFSTRSQIDIRLNFTNDLIEEKTDDENNRTNDIQKILSTNSYLFALLIFIPVLIIVIKRIVMRSR